MSDLGLPKSARRTCVRNGAETSRCTRTGNAARPHSGHAGSSPRPASIATAHSRISFGRTRSTTKRLPRRDGGCRRRRAPDRGYWQSCRLAKGRQRAPQVREDAL